MVAIFPFVLALIGAAPLLAVIDSPSAWAVIALATAIALVAAAMRLHPGEGTHLRSLLGPIAVPLAVPALWMFVQVLPIGVLAHPIWLSAEAALGTTLSKTASVDPGTTLIVLARYLTAVGMMVVVAAVAIDRSRAEWVLTVLVIATTVLAAILLAHELAGLTGGTGYQASNVAAARGATAIGTVLSAAAAIRAFERIETRRNDRDAIRHSALALIASLASLTVCVVALVYSNFQMLFAAASGLVLVVIVTIIRRIGLGVIESAALFAVAAVVGLWIAIGGLSLSSSEPSLRFAIDASAADVSLTQRVLADVPSAGTGAGTFASIARIYQAFGEPRTTAPPTTAAAIAVELGRPALWMAALVVIAFALAFLRGAFRRGRDAFYATAGAGCCLVVLSEAFCDLSAIQNALVILIATTFGLAFAQSASRSGADAALI